MRISASSCPVVIPLQKIVIYTLTTHSIHASGVVIPLQKIVIYTYSNVQDLTVEVVIPLQKIVIYTTLYTISLKSMYCGWFSS